MAALAFATMSQAAQAQVAGGFTLMPTFSAEESYLETRSRTNGDNGREAITRVAPGLRISSRSGSVQGSLDYSGSLYYRIGGEESRSREFRNSLTASFLAEAVPGRVYLDTRASISQQTLLAFGQQSMVNSLQHNDNRTEVSTLTLSPYLRGPLGSFASYEARLNATATDSRDPTGADTRSGGGSLSLRSARGGALLGWGLSASQQRTVFRGSNPSTVDNGRVDARLYFTPNPELQFSLTGGRESVDDGGGASGSRDSNTTGLGFRWAPSPRTSLSVDLMERFFGRSNRVSFMHRSPRTIWTYSLVRDTTTGADAFVLGQPMTLFQLMYEQLASAIPDAATREQFVLAQLAAQGQDPNQSIALRFLTSSYSVQRRQDLSMAWMGLRTTFSAQAYTTSQSRIVTISGGEPTFGEPTKQTGYSSTLSYRLTPTTTVGLGGSRLMTNATSTNPGTDLKSANANLTSRLGRRTSGQLGARYTVFNSRTDPYRETSVTASLSLRY
ncbi:MAG: TIGR03016 family PEP-CTERM system-associated outer membrane protein [Rubrivivax sp.]